MFVFFQTPRTNLQSRGQTDRPKSGLPQIPLRRHIVIDSITYVFWNQTTFFYNKGRVNGLLISLLVNYLYGSASWYEENLYSKSDLSFGFLMGHLSQIPNGRIRFHSLFRHISCLNGPSQLLSTKGKSSLGRKSEYGMMGDLPPLISAKYECMARKP